MDMNDHPPLAQAGSGGWTPETERLLDEWQRRMSACQHAYYLESERLRRWHYWLGIPAVVLSSVIGTAVFATLQKEEIGFGPRLVVALVSVAAAILSALQTFLRLAESASAHATAAGWFSAIKRDIEQVQAQGCSERGRAKDCLDLLRKEINKAAAKSPELRESLWMAVAGRYGVSEPRELRPPRRDAPGLPPQSSA